jgi:hypothetical protein
MIINVFQSIVARSRPVEPSAWHNNPMMIPACRSPFLTLITSIAILWKGGIPYPKGSPGPTGLEKAIPMHAQTGRSAVGTCIRRTETFVLGTHDPPPILDALVVRLVLHRRRAHQRDDDPQHFPSLSSRAQSEVVRVSKERPLRWMAWERREETHDTLSVHRQVLNRDAIKKGGAKIGTIR